MNERLQFEIGRDSGTKVVIVRVPLTEVLNVSPLQACVVRPMTDMLKKAGAGFRMRSVNIGWFPLATNRINIERSRRVT